MISLRSYRIISEQGGCDTKSKKTIKYIDLFAGLGGIRLGFKQAFEEAGFETNCVLTAEIKTAAVKALTTNFGMHTIQGDVTTIDSIKENRL